MEYKVFIDTIGEIFSGDYEEAVQNFDKYSEYSSRGIGKFANKSVYIQDAAGVIVKEFGVTKFKTGGTVNTSNAAFYKDFILGKTVNEKDVPDIFKVVTGADGYSALIYKNGNGEYPLVVKQRKGEAIFYKSNFTDSDFISAMQKKFKSICITNVISFEIK
jgi:hypothetical protein